MLMRLLGINPKLPPLSMILLIFFGLSFYLIDAIKKGLIVYIISNLIGIFSQLALLSILSFRRLKHDKSFKLINKINKASVLGLTMKRKFQLLTWSNARLERVLKAIKQETKKKGSNMGKIVRSRLTLATLHNRRNFDKRHARLKF